MDYKKFDYYCENNIFFITRLKRHSVINEVVGNHIIEFEERLLDESIEFIYDKVAYLGDKNTYKTKFPYRIIKILDENGKEIIFLTNLLNLSTEEIAWLYKKRWEIELFFKWIKQNLKIKRFIRYSLNAVMM